MSEKTALLGGVSQDPGVLQDLSRVYIVDGGVAHLRAH
jgi:hypothetical protein